MGVPINPSCDVCGTAKVTAPGIGLYCPNNKCGEEVELPPQEMPEGAKAIRISHDSVLTVLEENVRKDNAQLAHIKGKALFAVFADGTNRRIDSILMQVRRPRVERRSITRMTAPSERHPEGVQLRLASDHGVTQL